MSAAPPPGPAPVPPPGWGPPPPGRAPQPRWGLPPFPPEPPAPRKPPHRWGFGAYVLVELIFLAVSALLGWLVLGRGQVTIGALALGLAVPTMIAAATALLITRLRGNGPRIDLGLEWSWRDVGLGLAFGFGGLVMTIPASIAYVAILGHDTSSAVGDLFNGVRAGPGAAIGVFLIVVFLAPLCEEIVYRGLLWGAMEKHGAGRWLAFALTTLLFALAHFEFTRTPLLLIVAIPIGLARLYTGRLLASVVAHQINNLLPGLALMLGLLGAIPM
ncbi:CPBP family intramembrane glutamic endopeptidase [Pseudonocardia bannensis]|uniref:CPBP family intramembrane metalloprotease n=1 Tax=Pseudonocardia bannensis TaxID=630973 RepID=A0A848DKS1_9PSEU|nr:type II CAAX endopeptidase family protein [Pseudonocardia bannensis]NMH93149.1 CPBP family intramembrane metalloprotease [Pseudonocardia bannensis]